MAKRGIYLISYKKSTVKLMPKPYQTSCVDYSVKGYESKYDCIHKCNIKKYINIYKKYPSQYLIYNISSHLLHNNHYRSYLSFNITKECRNFCGYYNDCYKEHYKIDYFDKRLSNVITSNLYVMPSAEPITIITHSAKLSFQEYLCFVASIISLWFGYPIIILSDVFLLSYRKTNQYFYIYNSNVISILLIIINLSIVKDFSIFVLRRKI